MKLKKGDLVIVILVIAIGLGWLVKGMVWTDTREKQAIIKIDTEIYTTFPLVKINEHTEIPLSLPGDNYVHVISEKGMIWVEDASCPDKVCVKTGKISKAGQSIVCLPNKTVVYIEGREEDKDVDDLTY